MKFIFDPFDKGLAFNKTCQMLTLRSIDVDLDSQKTGLWILSYQGSPGLNKILLLK